MLRSRTSAVCVALLLATIAAAGCGSSPSAPSPSVDPSGTWVGTAIETAHPELPDRVTLVLSRAGNGYQGTISDEVGKIAQRTAVLNANWSAPTLTFAFQMADGTGVNVTVQITGDNMSGSYVDSQGVRGTVTCVRQR